MSNSSLDTFYIVSVVRDGVRRTSTMRAKFARETVRSAVSAGLEVTARPMTKSDSIILGVKEERVDAGRG